MKSISTFIILLMTVFFFACNSVKQNSSSELVVLAGHWKSFREVQLDSKGNVRREVTPKNNLVVSKRGVFFYWEGTETDTIGATPVPFFFNTADSLLIIGSKKLEDLVSTSSRPANANLFKAYLQDSILVLQPTTLEMTPKPLPALIYLKRE